MNPLVKEIIKGLLPEEYNYAGNCVTGLDDPYFQRNVCYDATEMAGIVDEYDNKFMQADEFTKKVNWPSDQLGPAEDTIYDFAYNEDKDIYWAYHIENDVHLFFIKDVLGEVKDPNDYITVKNILEQKKSPTTAVYAGGFKPPTSGHFEVVKQALKENPEVDEFIIFIGNKERNGISQNESLLIWEIYNNYLPFKVKIEPTSIPPIKAVYNFAKNHPTREVLWVIGAREGNEEDFKDITSRTSSISKYPNLELRTIITAGGVSGTAARNASKVSLDKFAKFVPNELSDEETEEVFNIVADKIAEGRKKKKDPKKGTGKKPKKSGRRLYTDEDPKDTVGVKFSTRQDIVDTLNKKSFKSKSHARQSQIINLIHQRVRAAYGRAKDPKVKKRLKTGLDYITKKKEASKRKTQRLKKLKEGDTIEKYSAKGKATGKLKQGTVRKRLGIPKDKKIPMSLINKELSRLKKMDKDPDKKGAQLGDKNAKYYKALQLAKTLKTTTNVSENATYSQHIDVMEKVTQLTNHMIDKGMNIEPLPTIEFIDGDTENAENFFGKTAYYDPNNQHIVVYTEGRHPKDILRSYAHEMIHHIQYLEDRLHNITTTNTNEDEDLDAIEKEAYVRGNMTFRNWTDSLTGNLTEGKKKDPFGLLAYAQELGRLREDEGEYKVYLDMDGVLADFDQRFRDISGMEPKEFENKYGTKAFWNLIDEENKIKFWVGIPPMPGAADLVNAVKDYNYELLTSPSAKKQSYLGKILWVKNHTGDVFPSKPRINFKKAKEKHLIKPQLAKTDILIDDREDTIGRWNAAGGTGIVYKNISQVLNDLGKLGL